MIVIHKYYLTEYFFSNVQFVEEKVKYMDMDNIIEYLDVREENEKIVLIIFAEDLTNENLKRLRKLSYKNISLILIGTEEQINILFTDNFKIKKAHVNKIISPIKIEYLKKLLEMEIYKCLVD